MPYELSDLTIDLVLLARYLLRPGGRLVWFLPTVAEEYQDIDIPVCEGMELVANSEQRFGKWGRRVTTFVYFSFYVLKRFSTARHYAQKRVQGLSATII